MSEVTQSRQTPKASAPLYVFEAPVRVWHWVHTLTIIALSVTGYLIANPLPSIGGEASSHFMMGTIRFIHIVSAHLFTIGFLVRVYWALVGNKYARELFIVPVWSMTWWKNLIYELRYYTFMTRTVHKEAGHNPLAQVAMFIFNVVLVLVLICTGYALHGEQLGHYSWADTLFGWVGPLLGNSQEVRMWHYGAMWLLLTFVVIHVYMAIRADIMGRQSSVSAIISGWRTYRDDRK